MSNARKLQGEIDKVLKKVDEGVELFDEIWEKVYSAEQQSQKEKYEVDLKKEIKKLQRLRDQIKTWISSSEVKDKDALVDARKLIETKMEQFKVCEKETKTKTYSKEGLARADKLSPEEQAKEDTCSWIGEVVAQLQQFVDDRDVEIEKLSSGKGKKSNKGEIEEHQEIMRRHKYHIGKLEGIMRLVMNDRLEPDLVNDLKEDLEYYIEAHGEEEFLQSYDEDAFYDTLGLEEMEIVNLDRVAQPQGSVKTSKSDDASSNSDSQKEKKPKKIATAVPAIPLTIGRARLTSAQSTISNTGSATKSEPSKDTVTPTKKTVMTSSLGSNPPVSSISVPTASSSSNASSVPTYTAEPSPLLVPSANGSTASLPSSRGPTPSTATSVNGAASMAAILKRDTEQQEKERQKQAALQQAAQQQRLLQEQQARAQAEQLRLQQLQRQQQEQIRQQEILRQQQQQQQQQAAAVAAAQAQAQQKAQQEALQRQQQVQEQQRQQAAQQEVKQSQLQAQQAQLHQATQQLLQQQQQQQQQQQRARSMPTSSNSIGGAALDALLTSGLGGLSLGSTDTPAMNPNVTISPQQQQSINTIGTPASSLQYDASETYLSALHESYRHCPANADSERQRSYSARNPYPTPSAYPSTPSPIFDNPAIFEKLGTDALFFIFYYSQGTYQQYLAARELKKQSWRYHKKYMTWFQRHEEPKVTTQEYEQGTYVYFDYETGWCQRIKSDFRFEYVYLEDSLTI